MAHQNRNKVHQIHSKSLITKAATCENLQPPSDITQEIKFFEAFDFRDDGPEEEDDEVQIDEGNSDDIVSVKEDAQEMKVDEDIDENNVIRD